MVKKADTGVFSFPTCTYALRGIEHKMAAFIAENQLKDKSLWASFVNQFRAKDDSGDNGWRGEYWGKMMRGACLVYQVIGDQALYSVLQEATEALLQLQEPSGRLSAYRADKELCGWDMWGRKYVMLGLLSFYEICDSDTLKAEIIRVLKGHADYIIAHIGNGAGQTPIGETSDIWGAVNSSTILEPMVKLYRLTGEQRYFDFATYIIENGGSNCGNLIQLAYENKLDPHQYPVVKAYETMSFFEGVLEYYLVTDEAMYKTAAENFAQRLIASEITIIGCAGCMHELFDNAAVTQTIRDGSERMQETCVTVTWMKLCSKLLCLTGNSIYAEQIEKSAYNALYGAVNTQKSNRNGGLPFDSYSPLKAGVRGNGIAGLKVIDAFGFYGCCAAIGAAGLGLFPRCAVLTEKSGIAVNFYPCGSYTIKTSDGQTVALRVDTQYPVGKSVTITLEQVPANTMEVKLRIPACSADTAVVVNGEQQIGVKAGYFCLDRVWAPGDKITLDFTIAPSVIRQAGADGKDYIAVKYGPLVLARDARLGENIDLPIRVSGKEVAVTAVKSDKNMVDALCEYAVSFDGGQPITMIDYASAGKTWDERSKMAAWLPVEAK